MFIISMYGMNNVCKIPTENLETLHSSRHATLGCHMWYISKDAAVVEVNE